MAKDDQGHRYCEPANSIIEKCGGVQNMVEACAFAPSWVYRWRYPLTVKGGTGGRVPYNAERRILAAVRAGHLPTTLTERDFDMPAPPAEAGTRISVPIAEPAERA